MNSHIVVLAGRPSSRRAPPSPPQGGKGRTSADLEFPSPLVEEGSGEGGQRPALLLFLLLVIVTACTPPRPAPDLPAAPEAAALPQTRAERTGYTETSSYADVVQFLDSLRALGAPIHLDTLGFSTEGRAIPLVIASRPLLATPEAARASGRPVVYLQGNIHAGEVEGKEALQMLLRDLLFDPAPNVLDSLVLLVTPIYNADGNEKLAPQARNRSEQNGPALIGERANGQGLDLNRDYVKAAAPETRAALALFRQWEPDVFVDLHTTDGSYHGYALTYAPSLNPAAGAAGLWTRDALLPELRRRLRERQGLETFDYGNFANEYGADVNTDTTKQGWFSYDARPRFGTNYYGLRGGVSVLSEAFSHEPFERRVQSTYAFVAELLSLAAERGDALLAVTRPDSSASTPVPVRSELTRTPFAAAVIAEDLVEDPDSVPDEPGVPRGLRRTGRFRTVEIPVYDRFTPTLERTRPAAYALGPADTAAVRLLREHGVRVRPIEQRMQVRGEAFAIDSVIRAERPFQGHHETRLVGRWRAAERTLAPGSFLVPTAQPLGTLAVYLLEPESDDGLATWSNPVEGASLLHERLAPDTEFPVLRVLRAAR